MSGQDDKKQVSMLIDDYDDHFHCESNNNIDENSKYTDITSNSDSNDSTIDRRTKRGHTCCGCCCDVRRAVVIVDSITAILQFVGIIGYLCIVAIFLFPEEFSTITLSYWFAIITFNLFYFLAMVGGCIGAIRYNKHLIGIAVPFYGVGIVLDFMGILQPLGWKTLSMILTAQNQYVGFVLTILLQVCFAYPHFVLIHEIRAGIMTDMNYMLHEKKSCCCVS